MIELRWVERPAIVLDDIKLVRVLQYRTRTFRSSLPYNCGFEGWCDWMDVPEVSE